MQRVGPVGHSDGVLRPGVGGERILELAHDRAADEGRAFADVLDGGFDVGLQVAIHGA